MVWRSVVINQPARLRREHFALLIEQQQAARVPFEDIAVVVLNNREITLTHPVLSACAEYGISLFSTGDNHQPNGVFLPFFPTAAPPGCKGCNSRWTNPLPNAPGRA